MISAPLLMLVLIVAVPCLAQTVELYARHQATWIEDERLAAQIEAWAMKSGVWASDEPLSDEQDIELTKEGR